MVQTLFPLIADEKMDARSAELRDHLINPKSLGPTLSLLHLASPDVLDGATTDLHHHAKKSIRHQRAVTGEPSTVDLERGRLLRQAANELRAAGRLRESAEAFRRAFHFLPDDGWLIYEFARFLRSQASATRDAQLLARSRAALRLAARRSGDDARLLSRIGENFMECGELRHATRAFERALELDPRAFPSEIGLAELALREGKLAHVIHHYGAAARIAADQSLARFARREADYYARLNDDDDYLAAELRRMNWLQHAQGTRRIAARISLASLLLAIAGNSLDEMLAAVGWSLASSAVIAWVGLAVAGKILVRRRKAHPVE
jgi:tetratricopeptide (TPR) repeat protein